MPNEKPAISSAAPLLPGASHCIITAPDGVRKIALSRTSNSALISAVAVSGGQPSSVLALRWYVHGNALRTLEIVDASRRKQIGSSTVL